jgi:hypothetical protein
MQSESCSFDQNVHLRVNLSFVVARWRRLFAGCLSNYEIRTIMKDSVWSNILILVFGIVNSVLLEAAVVNLVGDSFPWDAFNCANS